MAISRSNIGFEISKGNRKKKKVGRLVDQVDGFQKSDMNLVLKLVKRKSRVLVLEKMNL